MAFRARKVFGTFEKQAPAFIFGVEKLSHKLSSLRVFERVFLFFWSSINLSIGLSRDTNVLDCSAIRKNIS